MTHEDMTVIEILGLGEIRIGVLSYRETEARQIYSGS